MADEEPRDVADILALEIERGLAAYALHQRRGIAGIPARQHLEFRPADAKELIARRIMQRPGRRAVERAWTGIECEFLAQRRQHAALGGGPRRPPNPPLYSGAASGRRPEQKKRRTLSPPIFDIAP